jgi:tripartite-type tricarboxylate transporter receptor subunit TctC
MRNRLNVHATLALVATAMLLSSAHAQNYPVKPIRMIVASGTGGGLDLVARLVAPRLSESLGQAVVVDNRAGAGGDIAIELTAQSPADGYTLVIMSSNSVLRSILYKTRFDPLRDLAPVSQIAGGPNVLLVSAASSARNVAELVALARANPGKLNYGTSGNGTLGHLATELFASTTGISLVHVPYKGFGAVFSDLVSGQIQLTLANPAAASPLVRAQRLRALAVTSAKRSPSAPDLPTMAESGVPGFDVTQWHAALAPRGTPASVIERLYTEIAKAVQQADVASRLRADGVEAVASSPREFAQHLKREHEKWSRVIARAGIRGE